MYTKDGVKSISFLLNGQIPLKKIASNEEHLRDYTMPNDNDDKVSRHELKAELKYIEARMEASVQRIEDKFVSLTEEFKSLRMDIKDSRQEANNDKKQIIYTIIGSVVAFIGVTAGVLALNASWQQNFLNSMDARVNAMQQSAGEINNQQVKR